MRKIVRGNDVVLRIPVTRVTGGESFAFPLGACTEMTVGLVSAFRRYALAWELDAAAADGNVVLARLEGDAMPCGVYALEVRGKAWGADWRSNELEQVVLVDNNASADTEFEVTDDGEPSVEMDTAVIVMGASTPALNPCGEWSATVAYKRGDTVSHGLGCWWAYGDNTCSEPVEGSADWVVLIDATPFLDELEQSAASATAAAATADTAADNATAAAAQALATDKAVSEAEAERASAELARAKAEDNRASAETTRQDAETARQDAETTRTANETARQDAETNRASAETARVEAETARADAEAAREAASATAVRNAGQATSAAQTATEAATAATADAKAATTEANTATDNANTATKNADTATDAAKTATADANKATTAANNAATKATEAATKATTVAGNVNADLTDNVLTVTNASGTKKSLSLADAASVAEGVANANRSSLALGHYSDRDSITLTATETNKAISSDGVKVTKSGWAIAEFTAEKGNEYLFKPGTTDGAVCVFAEYIDKVEDRAIDYTYTYNADGTVATATATYGGKTYKYAYAYASDGSATITDASGNTVTTLPLLYTTTVGTYSPLVRLNAGAELPTDGYCRFMSHFQGNSALKVVVSYKAGSAELTMLVLRDGVFASISTQLGNLSQKQSDTANRIEKLTESYMDVVTGKDAGGRQVSVDGELVTLGLRKKTRLYPKARFRARENYSSWYANLCHADVSHLDTSGFTSMQLMFFKCSALATLDVSGWDTGKVTNMHYMFDGCSSLATLDVSGWDVSKVTNMYYMFNGCSSLATLDVSGWDVSKVTSMGGIFGGCSSLTSLVDVSGWDTGNVTRMDYMFNGCSSLATLDVSGWDTGKVTNMGGMFQFCSALTELDVSGWDTSNVTNMSSMFFYNSALTELDVSGWDTSNVTNMGSMFFLCSSLATLIGSHTLEEVEAGTVVALEGCKVSLALNNSTKLDRKSLLAVIKGLATVTTATTLTLGTTLKARLTSDDIAIATGKGWTIA